MWMAKLRGVRSYYRDNQLIKERRVQGATYMYERSREERVLFANLMTRYSLSHARLIAEFTFYDLRNAVFAIIS